MTVFKLDGGQLWLSGHLVIRLDPRHKGEYRFKHIETLSTVNDQMCMLLYEVFSIMNELGIIYQQSIQ